MFMYYLAYDPASCTDSEPRVYGIFHSLSSVFDFLFLNGLAYCHVQVFSIDRGITNFSWEDGKIISTDMTPDTIKKIVKSMVI